MTTLPAELTDAALDYLWDDSPSLRACSLVCRTWCPRSRLHLWATVTIWTSDQLHVFEHLLESCPEIGSHVRNLFLGRASDSTVLGKPAPAILTSLPNVESYHLHCSQLTRNLITRDLPTSDYANIRMLSLKNVVVEMVDFFQFICSSPHLLDLALERVIITSTVPYDMLPSGPRVVDTVRIRQSGPSFFQCALDSRNPLHFRRLELSIMHLPTDGPEMALLHHAGDNLAHLSIRVRVKLSSSWRFDGQDMLRFHMSHNTNLQSLRIRVEHELPTPLGYPGLPFILSCLSSEHTQLRQISIVGDYHTFVEGDPHWTQTNRLLLRLASERSHLEVIVQLRRPPDVAFETVRDMVLSGLSWFTSFPRCLRIIAGTEWMDDYLHGDLLVKNTREWVSPGWTQEQCLPKDSVWRIGTRGL